MTNSLICLLEHENKNCVKWCYPPRFAKNLTLLQWTSGQSLQWTPRSELQCCVSVSPSRLPVGSPAAKLS